MGSEELTWIEGQAKESVTRAVTFNSFSITWDGKETWTPSPIPDWLEEKLEVGPAVWFQYTLS